MLLKGSHIWNREGLISMINLLMVRECLILDNSQLRDFIITEQIFSLLKLRIKLSKGINSFDHHEDSLYIKY